MHTKEFKKNFSFSLNFFSIYLKIFTKKMEQGLKDLSVQVSKSSSRKLCSNEFTNYIDEQVKSGMKYRPIDETIGLNFI